MEVFIDSDSALAMAWTEQGFESYRDHSEPIDGSTLPTDGNGLA